MATITPATTYPNGTTLSINGHNANVYSTTAGQGIFSEPNGGLSVVNLDASFTIRDEHIMPEEAVIARMDGTVIPMDVYNNAFGLRDDVDAAYTPIAGLGERVYVPYDMSSVVWQWSFYVSVWRPYMYDYTTGAVDTGTIALRLFIDGVEYPAFRRFVPVSGDLDTDWDRAGGPYETSSSVMPTGIDVNNEHTTALWFDISKLQKDVSKGFHELTIKLYLPRVIFGKGGDFEAKISLPVTDFGPSGDPANHVNCTIHQRISFGSRNVRCVMFR